MKPELWNSAKSLYLQAISSSEGPDSYLLSLDNVDAEVLKLVSGLLEQQPELAPDIHHPCWFTGCDRDTRVLDPGYRLTDRFEIVGFLGSGGMGEVYRAFDHQQQVFVAAKVLRMPDISDPRRVAALRNELNTARAITHHNICRLYDFHWTSSADNPPFFTMELLEGETLCNFGRRTGPLSESAAAPIVYQIIDGMEAAHGRGIVHSDLKSGNVMLTDNGTRAVLMDFGLAREFQPGESLESTFTHDFLAGTPAYMAPEQLRGKRATFASDIHSFGVMLFEVLAGRRPFEGDSPLETALQRLNGDAPPLRRYAPKVSRGWDYTIHRCLSAKPEDRPKSICEVRNLLQGSAPVLWARRRIVLGVVTVVPAAVGSAGIWALVKSAGPARVDVYDFENQTGDPILKYLSSGTTTEVARRLAAQKGVVPIPVNATLAQAAKREASHFGLSGVIAGDALNPRMNVRVEDPRGGLIWTGAYDASRLRNVLQVQEEIARETFKGVRRSLTLSGSSAGGELRAAVGEWLPGGVASDSAPTRSATAFQYYMRGNSLLQESSPESTLAAIDYLKRAVAEDPHFALGFASLAEAYLAILNFGYDHDGTMAAQARENAKRAIQEDHSLPEAHAVAGSVHQLDWDWLAAETEFNEALRRRPNFARARRWRAGLVLQFGRFEEALAGMREAAEQDPFDRSAASGYSLTLMFAGKAREAAHYLERSVNNRDMAPARHNLSQAYALLARESTPEQAGHYYEKALEQARIVAGLEQRPSPVRSELSTRMFAFTYAMKGENDAAAPHIEKLEQAVKTGGTSPGPLAMVYAAQRRIEMAQNSIERAFFLRDRFVLYLRVNIFLEILRGQPRFEAVLRSLRLK